MQQPVRVEGVRLYEHLLVRERDANLSPRGHDARVYALATRTEFARDVLFARDAVLGKVGVQLKWQPAHGRLRCIGMALAVTLKGPLELALPDETPGSNHVRYDVYR